MAKVVVNKKAHRLPLASMGDGYTIRWLRENTNKWIKHRRKQIRLGNYSSKRYDKAKNENIPNQ